MIKRIIAFAALAALAIFGTPLIRPAGADFAQQGSYGGVSTGSANAQVISLGNIAAMSQLRGVTISFTVGSGLTNTGPATIGVGSLSAVAIDRMNSGTLMALGGGEMPAGKMVQGFYDGTEIVLLTDYTGGAPVGSEQIAAYGTADPGYVLEYGQCLATASSPAAAAKVGTTNNTADGCTTGQFGIPDKRGRTAFGQDNMGGTAANRITVAGGNFNGTILGGAGGTQGYASGIGATYLTGLTLGVPTNQQHTLQASYNPGSNWDVFSNDSGGIFTGTTTNNPQTTCTNCAGTSFPTLSNGQISIFEMKL